MKTKIYINRNMLSINKKNKTKNPIFAIKTYNKTEYAHEIRIVGNSKLVYIPDDPLNDGCKLWVETFGEVEIIK